MESHLFEIDLLTAFEPRNCKSLEINETISRFMESHLFEIDLLTALEPRNCKSLEINETISRFMESPLRIRFAGVGVGAFLRHGFRQVGFAAHEQVQNAAQSAPHQAARVSDE